MRTFAASWRCCERILQLCPVLAACTPSSAVATAAPGIRKLHTWAPPSSCAGTCRTLLAHAPCPTAAALLPATRQQCKGFCQRSEHGAQQPPTEPCGADSKPTKSTSQTPAEHPPAPASTHGNSKASAHRGAGRLGLFGMAGFFGQRALLFLGGKKAAMGLFSVISLKKLLFLPAWLWVIFASGGAVSFPCDMLPNLQQLAEKAVCDVSCFLLESEKRT